MKRTFAALLACLTVLAVSACSSGHHATVTTSHHAGPAPCRGYQTQYGCSAHSPTFGLPPTGPPKLTPPSSAPTSAMYDSVTVSVLPHGAAAYAGYLFGNFVTFPSLVTGFPGAVHVPVVIHASEIVRGFRMVCLDVEPGDEWPVTAAVGAWARAEISVGVKPCEYGSLNNGMTQIEQSVAAALGAQWHSEDFLWDADWTNTAHLDTGFDATQWTDHFENRNVDGNAVTRAFLGLDTPAPGPKVLGGKQHYERYPQGAPARPDRERPSIIGWDSRHCTNPVRRPACKVTHAHLLYDLGRDQALYARDSKTLRNTLHLPGRIQGDVNRLKGRGVVKQWL